MLARSKAQNVGSEWRKCLHLLQSRTTDVIGWDLKSDTSKHLQIWKSEKLYGIHFGWGFNSTLSALASARCWDHALALLRDMQGGVGKKIHPKPAKLKYKKWQHQSHASNGEQKNRANFPLDSKLTYLTLILLYHIAGRADPNVVSYNTAISACADGEGEWEHAIQLLKQMQRCQVEPDCWRVAMRGDLAWGMAL